MLPNDGTAHRTCSNMTPPRLLWWKALIPLLLQLCVHLLNAAELVRDLKQVHIVSTSITLIRYQDMLQRPCEEPKLVLCRFIDMEIGRRYEISMGVDTILMIGLKDCRRLLEKVSRNSSNWASSFEHGIPRFCGQEEKTAR